jgi:hypothetical protein
MSISDYRQILETALQESSRLSKERDQIDVKLQRLRHFVYATVNMLPDAERNVYQAELAMLASRVGSLTDAVRETLKLATERNSYWTATEVRDHLKNSAFDFSQYTSNPLASVNTVLRRFKPSEVETSTRDGVTTYRWVTRVPGPEAEQGRRRAIRLED